MMSTSSRSRTRLFRRRVGLGMSVGSGCTRHDYTVGPRVPGRRRRRRCHGGVAPAATMEPRTAGSRCRRPPQARDTMALLTQTPYKVREVDLSGLVGISDHTLEVHFGLYAGYVKNTNTLNEQLWELLQAGRTATPAYSELTRRQGFEYNGMVLHELY